MTSTTYPLKLNLPIIENLEIDDLLKLKTELSVYVSKVEGLYKQHEKQRLGSEFLKEWARFAFSKKYKKLADYFIKFADPLFFSIITGNKQGKQGQYIEMSTTEGLLEKYGIFYEVDGQDQHGCYSRWAGNVYDEDLKDVLHPKTMPELVKYFEENIKDSSKEHLEFTDELTKYVICKSFYECVPEIDYDKFEVFREYFD